jgi:hypothetical protein
MDKERRDQLSAEAAIHAAHQDGKTAGIVVDDAPKVEKMLKRVKRIATKMHLEFEVERSKKHVNVFIGEGCVRIIGMT